MRRVALSLALCGGLTLGGCASVDESYEYAAVGAAAGAFTGATAGVAFGEPLAGALVGGFIGAVSAMLYGEYAEEQKAQ